MLQSRDASSACSAFIKNQDLFKGSRAASTWRAYESDWRIFSEWCAKVTALRCRCHIVDLAAGTCGHREHTFPRKRGFTGTLYILYNLLIYDVQVGRLATELSLQVIVRIKNCDAVLAPMPPRMPLPMGGCPGTSSDKPDRHGSPSKRRSSNRCRWRHSLQTCGALRTAIRPATDLRIQFRGALDVAIRRALRDRRSRSSGCYQIPPLS